MIGMHSSASGGPTRVLYVVPGLNVGGAEWTLLELIRRIDRGLVDPLVCSLFPGGTLRETFTAEGIPVVELHAGPGLGQVLGAAIVPVLLRWRPSIVHSRLVLGNLWGCLGRLVGARVICEELGTEDDRPRRATWLNQVPVRLSSVVTTNAQAVAERVWLRDGVDFDHIRIIRNGVDTQRFSPRAPESSVDYDVITVCRLEPIKGLMDLLDAVERAVAQMPGLRVAIVGAGSQRQALEDAVSAKGLEAVVSFAGEQHDVAAWLRRARLFVLPSYQEGLPGVVLEAMACGLPVVATAVGGTPELVLDGQTGQLVPPHRPDELGAAVLGYLRQRHVLDAHGRAARQHVETNFDINGMVRAYERLYCELLARGE